MQAFAADLAVLAAFTAVIGLFALSPITLESRGIGYLSSGGGVFAKLHPSTFIAIAALFLRALASRRPIQTAWRLATADSGAVLLVAAVVIAGIVAVGFAKTPVTPLVDTFVLPVLVFLLVRDLDPVLIRWMAIILALLMCANAIIALSEFLRGWRFIHIDIPDNVTSDPTRSDAVFSWQAEFAQEWRATALLGHPLVNGLLTGAFILCLAAQGSRWLPARISAPLGALQFAAMFAFGARAALVFTVAIGTLLLAHRCISAVNRGARLQPRMLALALVVVALGIVALGVLLDVGFFDKMIERFSQDAGSAETRRTMFDLFGPISWTDLLLGPDQDQITTLRRMYGLEFGIESSWLGLALNYGIIVTVALIAGLLAFCRSVLHASGIGASAVLSFYLILVSAAATMSTKTTSFAMTIALILVFLPVHGLRTAQWSRTARRTEGSWR